MKKEGKRGQVTVFVIVAVVIVALFVLFFVFRGGLESGITGGDGEVNPDRFLRGCVEDEIREGVEIISSQGGYIEPELSRNIDGENISYLCYNRNYYRSCINQEPVLLKHLDSELENYVEEDIESCFNSFTNSLESDGFSVDSSYNGFDITLAPDRIELSVDGEATASKPDETRRIENPEMIIGSKFYDNSVVAQEIISQEAEYCNFENIGFGLIYPEFSIERFKMGDSTTIYTIINKQTEEEFKFLVRSCAIPPGI